MRAPFVRRDDGGIDAELPAEGADAIRRVAEEFLDALADPTDVMYRLFPPAYPDDHEHQQEFAGLTHEDLVARKMQAARDVIASIDAGLGKRKTWRAVLDEEVARAWLGVINDARLTLGTSLDVTEGWEPFPQPGDDPESHARTLYFYLGMLEEFLVEALAGEFE